MGKSNDLPAELFPTEAPTQKSTRWLQWAGAKVNEETGKVIPKAKPKRRATMAAAVFNRARAETQAMTKSGDWSECTSRHLIALYDIMHAQVYGVEVIMSSSERHTAVLRVGSFVKRVFDGDFDKALDYFQWLWTRETGREKWRRENMREGQRLTIGACISGNLVTDYRLALTRAPRR